MEVVPPDRKDLEGLIGRGHLNLPETLHIRQTITLIPFSLLLGVGNLYEKVIVAVLVNLTEADPHTTGDVVVPDFQFAVILVP